MQQARATGDKELIRKLRHEHREQMSGTATGGKKTYKDILERRASFMMATGTFIYRFTTSTIQVRHCEELRKRRLRVQAFHFLFMTKK